MVYVIYNFEEVILGRCVPNVWSSYVLPPSLFVCCPKSVSVRETRFSRDKHLGTEGVFIYVDANNKMSFIFVCNGFMLD
jgi:hypothetical protein